MKERVSLWLTALSAFIMSVVDILDKVGLI